MSEVEQPDALPVPARAARIVPSGEARAPGPALRRSRASAVQTAAAAAGGFVAGAAVLGIVAGRRGRSGAALAKGAAGPARRRGFARRRAPAALGAGAETLQVLASRTLLLDVHLLGTPGAEG